MKIASVLRTAVRVSFLIFVARKLWFYLKTKECNAIEDSGSRFVEKLNGPVRRKSIHQRDPVTREVINFNYQIMPSDLTQSRRTVLTHDRPS